MSEPEELSFVASDTIKPMDIVNLLCGAFDSGITYWCPNYEEVRPKDFDIDKISWLKKPDDWRNVRKVYLLPLLEGGKVILNDAESGEKHTLDLAAIRRGVKAMSEKYPKQWADFRSQNDDAETADIFVQCCIFGDAIYG